MTEDTKDMSLFNRDEVLLVWGFDAKSQTWMGYSADPEVQEKLKAKNISELNALSAHHGFWIESKRSWVLNVEDKEVEKSESRDSIALVKGWNLLSLPVNMAISPVLFSDATLWKYGHEEWQFFDANESIVKESNLSQITSISNLDGFWVNSDIAQEIDLVGKASDLTTFKTVESVNAYIKEMYLTNQRPFYGCMMEPAIFGGQWNRDFNFSDEDGIMETITNDSAVNEEADFVSAPSQDASSGSSVAEKSGEESSAVIEDTTNTNIQEVGVDEADIMKHDGNNIFYLARGENRIYINTFARLLNNETKPLQTLELDNNADEPIFVEDSVFTSDSEPLELLILAEEDEIFESGQSTSSSPSVAPQVEPSITIGGDEATSKPYYNKQYFYANEMYLRNNRLILIGSGNEMQVRMYDVSDIKNITLINEFSISGNYKNSRLVGDRLLLISSFYPSVQVEYPKIKIDIDREVCNDNLSDFGFADVLCYFLYDEGSESYQYDYENPIVVSEQYLPTIKDTLSGMDKTLIAPENFYASLKSDQAPNITAITEIDINSSTMVDSIAYLGSTSTEYVSQKALYLVSSEYPFYSSFESYQPQSLIYKFSYENGLTFNAKGSVKGEVLNQFSLSESKDILRIATTEFWSWQSRDQSGLNSLYILSDTLNELGEITGLGNAGEQIKSVRFVGDRAYVVTFRQTDPFYTLDLSDPINPLKVGELKVDGFSSYLHPVNDDLILGVGRDADAQGRTGGIKIELFDISDFANPVSADTKVFGDNSFYSEAEHNHKAFVYRASDKLFGLPYRGWTGEDTINNFNIYEISENNSIEFLNTISLNDGGYGGSNSRGIFFNSGNKRHSVLVSEGRFYSTLVDTNKVEELSNEK